MSGAGQPTESGRTWPHRWFASQAGSREYFAVPRSLHMTSRLEHLYTGSWARRGRTLMKKGPEFLWGYANHWHQDLPDRKVTSFDLGTIGWFIHRASLARPKTVDQVYHWEVDNSEWFGRRTWRAMKGLSFDPRADGFIGFMTECLEVLEPLKQRGVPTILDMAGPGKMDDIMIAQETERWPHYAKMGAAVPERYYERVRRETDAATIALVNSEWSRQAWIKQGVPDHKIIVVPLAYEPPAGPPPTPRTPHDRPLTVLWLGSVILRKGIPYLVEAAKLLKASSVKFVLAGPIGISERAVSESPPSMNYLGRITSEQKQAIYREADVFVIPTMSDGFAITQLEAMAQGMPVIATPNCGNVVTHGEDGLIVSAADPESLAEAIARLDADRGLLAAMSGGAIAKSRQFTVRRFGESVNAARARVTFGSGSPAAPIFAST